MKESDLMRRIQLEASRRGMRVFRNNVGLFVTDRGTKVRTGLCVGSSDLVGWKSIVVTNEMVGERVAVFIALEVKRPGERATKEQQRFLEAVHAAGGVAIIAQGEEDLDGDGEGQGHAGKSDGWSLRNRSRDAEVRNE